MYILALETTGPKASAALLRGSEAEGKTELLGEKSVSEAKNHLKNLIPLVQQLLAETGVKKSELTHIAASVGPGSFTGIRIGVSTARALAQTLNLPCIAVPTLEIFCAADHRDTCPKDAVVCGIINARRGQVYGIIGDGYLPGGPYMLTEVLAVIAENVWPSGKAVVFCGDGVDAYETQIKSQLDDAGMTFGRDYFFAPEETRYQSASAAAEIAACKAQKQETLSFAALVPDYMRKAEAEVKLAAGQLPICKGPKQE